MVGTRSPPTRSGSSPIAVAMAVLMIFFDTTSRGRIGSTVRARHYQVLRGRMIGRLACRAGQEQPEPQSDKRSISTRISCAARASASMKLPPNATLVEAARFTRPSKRSFIDGFQNRDSSLSHASLRLAAEDVCVQEFIPEFALRVVFLAQLNKLRPTTRTRTTTILVALPEFCDRNYLDELSRRFKASRAGRNCGSAARARRKA